MIRIAAPQVGEAEIEAMARTVASGQLAQGAEVAAFEEEFAAHAGARFGVAVSSGTAALHVALLAHGIGPGASVVTTPFSFIATANAILMAGARPLFADIAAADFNIDPEAVARAIEPDTKAILAVHLYGQAAPLAELRQLAAERGLVLIEDACQAHGAGYNGETVGASGTACYSFYPTKNMTTGEGGIILTDDAEVDRLARMIRSHGSSERYRHEVLGYNFRMTDPAAAIGRVQLKRLDGFNGKRRANAAALNEALAGIPGLVTPPELPGRRHVYHQYAVRLTEDFPLSREEFAQALKAEGVESDIHYPAPITRQPFFTGLGEWPSMPVAEQAAAEVLSLPVHPGLDEKDMAAVAEAVGRVLS